MPAAELAAVRVAAEQIGIIQLVNHGLPDGVIAEFWSRMGRVLSLPRDRKEELKSPEGYPYRGWWEWRDESGRLEMERYTVGQFDSPAEVAAAGLQAEHCAAYATTNVWPADDPGLPVASISTWTPAGRWPSRCCMSMPVP